MIIVNLENGKYITENTITKQICEPNDNKAESSKNFAIRRIKHVERNGWLWIIAEFLHTIVNSSIYQCRVCTIDLKTLQWRIVTWDPQCTFDELTLDVAQCGTVVLLKKRMNDSNFRVFTESFMFINRTPCTLLRSSFLTLLQSMPAIRNLTHTQLKYYPMLREFLEWMHDFSIIH